MNTATDAMNENPLNERQWPTRLLIGGKTIHGQGRQITVVNPASTQTVTQFPGASIEQVGLAVENARNTFNTSTWANDTQLRVRSLARFAELIGEHADELMDILISENGTPISLKNNQVGFPVDFLQWFSQQAGHERVTDLGLNRSGTARSRVAYRPVGVVAAISSYNYPLQIAVIKIGAALAVGCTAVLLSSPQAPLGVARLGELALEAGIPAGVLNVISGGADVGKALCEHPGVDKVSFTGSVGVGQQVMAQAVAGLKGVVLELGGKSPAILLPGADFNKYGRSLHRRYARHAGQGCGSPTRLLVEESRLEEFIDISREAYQALYVGDPRQAQTVVGPLISESHRDRVEAMVSRALADGARIVAGGGRPSGLPGWYMNPTLIAGVTNQAEIARQEIFGPVGVILTYRNVDEAIDIANDSELGLRAYLFGDAAQCESLVPRLRVGTVLINGGGGDPRPDAPGCGYKLSGIAPEGGEDGIREFLLTQHIDRALT
jgi:aldehyde dehydrogenase (NAD+)/betaine-aldehyde dehydrogenase